MVKRFYNGHHHLVLNQVGNAYYQECPLKWLPHSAFNTSTVVNLKTVIVSNTTMFKKDTMSGFEEGTS